MHEWCGRTGLSDQIRRVPEQHRGCLGPLRLVGTNALHALRVDPDTLHTGHEQHDQSQHGQQPRGHVLEAVRSPTH
jgi:hypothetical protein